MTVILAGIEFEHHHYDERGDVLYLSTAEYKDAPQPYADATPEGHAVYYDESGRVTALTLVNIKWLVERDGELKITWPEVVGHLPSSQVLPVLAAAA